MSTKLSLLSYLVEQAKYEFEYHDNLNEDLWVKNNEIKTEVREALLRISNEFIDFLEVPSLDVVDIILTGSMANYNWTDMSDIDLHVVIKELSEKSCGVNPDEYFMAKKALWNENHNITIYEHPVELYVQKEQELHTASGVYSVQNNTWNIKPEKKNIDVDDHSVQTKAQEIMHKIDSLVDSNSDDIDAVDKLREKIKHLRINGLHTGGEFSVENLAFKFLRNSGYLKKLADYKRQIYDKDLSLK